ncbi:MAG: hypothetical protein AAGM67_17215, partial [Bacteroidota bacterium]
MSSDFDHYLAWARNELGITFSDKLEIRVIDEELQERGIFAKSEISECESLIEVPLDALLYVQSILNTPFGEIASTPPVRNEGVTEIRNNIFVGSTDVAVDYEDAATDVVINRIGI